MDPQNIELELKDEKEIADDNEEEDEGEEEEEEELICQTKVDIVSSPPEIDNKSSCGIDRPYFGYTWGADTDQAKELQEIGKAVSSGKLIEEDLNVTEESVKEDRESKVISEPDDNNRYSEIHESNEQNGTSVCAEGHATDIPLVPKADEDSKTTEKAEIWPPKLTVMDLISAIISCIFFIMDIASDWRLVVIYYLDKEFTLFYLTLAFIMVPALILGIISIIWSVMEHAHNKKLKARQSSGSNRSDQQAEHDSNPHLAIRVVFSLLQLGRCFRLLEYMRFVIKSWREKDPAKEEQLRKKALQQKQDSAIFGLVDGFLESAPQFLLQLYLSISNQITMDFLRVATICLSWISTAMLQTSFYRNNRKVRKKKKNVGCRGALFYFLWRFSELGPRFIILVLTAFTFKFWTLIGIGVHFVFVFIFYKVQNPKLRGICCPGKKTFDIFFLFLMSYIGIFTYVNLKDGKTKYKLILFYAIYYIENFAMAVLVMVYFPSHVDGMTKWKNSIFIVFPGFLCHMVFMLTFYRCFHPTKHVSKSGGGCTGELKQRIQDIKCCGVNLV